MSSTKPIIQQAIGLFGGTFDPIHNGHITPILAAAQQLQLKQVLLMPAHIPPHKTQVVAPPHHRVAMLELVCQHQPLFTLDLRELKRQSTSYTIESLKEIKQEFPERAIIFFIGMDSLLTFTTWHQWQDIMNLCHLVVSARPRYGTDKINQQTSDLLAKNQVENIFQLQEHSAGKILLIEESKLDISSTLLRQQLKNSNAEHPMLPYYIQRYITQHKLYQPS